MIKVSEELLGVGFLFLYPEQDEFNRIGCLLSRVAGLAAFYWCHSAVGDGYTLYENGKVIEKIHDEYGGLGNLPFSGATYDDLVDAFYCRVSEVLSRNIPSLFTVIQQIDGNNFKQKMQGRKNSLLKKAEVIDRLVNSSQKDAAIELLRGDITNCAQTWFDTPPNLVLATIRATLEQLKSA